MTDDLDSSSPADRGWACEAYIDPADPPPPAVAASLPSCFFVQSAAGSCESLAECRTRMTEQRQRTFHRINELAAAGDELGVFLADEFTAPDRLLNAADDPDGPEHQ